MSNKYVEPPRFGPRKLTPEEHDEQSKRFAELMIKAAQKQLKEDPIVPDELYVSCGVYRLVEGKRGLLKFLHENKIDYHDYGKGGWYLIPIKNSPK